MTLDSLLKYLFDGFFVALVFCGIGCFFKAIFSKIKKKTKIEGLKILIYSVFSAICSMAIFDILSGLSSFSDSMKILLMFIIGMCSEALFTWFTNPQRVAAFIKKVVCNWPSIRRSITDAIKEIDEEEKSKKHSKKNKNQDIDDTTDK